MRNVFKLNPCPSLCINTTTSVSAMQYKITTILCIWYVVYKYRNTTRTKRLYTCMYVRSRNVRRSTDKLNVNSRTSFPNWRLEFQLNIVNLKGKSVFESDFERTKNLSTLITYSIPLSLIWLIDMIITPIHIKYARCIKQM